MQICIHQKDNSPKASEQLFDPEGGAQGQI